VTSADIPIIAMNFDGGAAVLTSSTSGQVTFTVGACTTPLNIPVTLAPVAANKFTGQGSAAGATSFNIDVNNCPPGLNTVSYQLDAAPSIASVNAANGVIGLNSSSTATGIALQLLDANGQPVALGAMRATTGYNRTMGGNFTIPLKAAYYQSGSRVTAGTVASQAVFTMSYQ
jgi:major type 1 subunit fimbrin (pilin)